jgi:hypothetical protein
MDTVAHSSILFVGVPITFAIVVIAVLIWLVRRRPRCPSCNAATLVRDRSVNAGGIELSTGGRMYRCVACNAEFRRHHDEGPLIPRSAWDAGSRDGFPKAQALPRKVS